MEYFWKSDPAEHGKGTIRGSDGQTAPCTYSIRRQEKFARHSGPDGPVESPVGFHSFDATIKSAITRETFSWMEQGSAVELELELEDGRRAGIFPKSSNVMAGTLEYLLKGDVPVPL